MKQALFLPEYFHIGRSEIIYAKNMIYHNKHQKDWYSLLYYLGIQSDRYYDLSFDRLNFFS